VLLIRKQSVGLIDGVARTLADPRDPECITYSLVGLLRQHVFALIHGYEDLNMSKDIYVRIPTKQRSIVRIRVACLVDSTAPVRRSERS
jgi:hypothetical protein